MTTIYNILNKTRVSFYIYKIMLLLFVVSLLSCEGVLDKKPLDKYSDALVWQDPTLISMFVSNTYRSIPSFGALPCQLAAFTDEMEIIGDGFDSQANGGTMTPSNVVAPLNFWTPYYSIIRKCNIFMDKIQTSGIDAALKTRMTGEMKVIRAYSYFYLINAYGGVPLIKTPLTLADDLNLPRNTYDECLAFVIADLDEAATMLPTTYAAADLGRITKGAALAVKSRALLYAASPLNNATNDLSKWQKAADAAKAVIDMGVYSLYPDYKKLFLQSAAYNSEIIWQRPFNNIIDFEIAVESALYPGGYNGRSQIHPIHNIVADYEMTSGLLPANDPAYNPQNPYVNRDPRFYASILYEGAQFKGRAVQVFVPFGLDGDQPSGGAINVSRPGYFLRKFMDETINDPIDTRIGNTPWTFFRYGEILLNYAEANYYLGNEVVCRDNINKIRSRPGVLMPNVTESGANLLKRLQNERRIELAFESHRFFDVRRWKIAPVVLNVNCKKMLVQKDPTTGVTTYSVIDLLPARAFFDKNYRMPIPQSEIDKVKNPGFTQNPGY